MPGAEDYPYVDPEGPPQIAHAVPETSQADSNPAYYPPEAKSEALRTEDEKQQLAENEANLAKNTDPAGDDPEQVGAVKTGDGEEVLSGEDAKTPTGGGEDTSKGNSKDATADTPAPAKSNIPKSTSK